MAHGRIPRAFHWVADGTAIALHPAMKAKFRRKTF
jgi:hypothetical protein